MQFSTGAWRDCVMAFSSISVKFRQSLVHENLTLGKKLLLNDNITTEWKQICLLCVLIQLHVQIEGINVEKVSTEQLLKTTRTVCYNLQFLSVHSTVLYGHHNISLDLVDSFWWLDLVKLLYSLFKTKCQHNKTFMKIQVNILTHLVRDLANISTSLIHNW